MPTGPTAKSQSNSRQKHLETELEEQKQRYGVLTERIKAIDSDWGRAQDGEQRLTLRERRKDLEAERQEVAASMEEIESQLAALAEGTQDVQQPPSQKVAPSSAEVTQNVRRPKSEAQDPPWVRASRRRLLAGLAAIVAVTVIAFVSDINLPRLIQPTATPAAISTPVSTATSEAVILIGDMMTVTSPIEMELVRVPAGEFLMGSDPAKDSLAYDRELPQHRVNLPEYYIGKVEVTNAQYQGFVRAAGYESPSNWDNGVIPAGKENHPVVYVSWNDATAFAGWLSAAATGLACRLPTEAEWEKTCRGTEGFIYPWGDSAPDSGQANFNSNVGDTTSVGSYSPKGDSPYGATDMTGNVWEWTGSLWGRDVQKPDYGYPYDPTDGREDLDAPNDVWRVVRGGSYVNGGRIVRCAHRDLVGPDYRLDVFGFRVVCVSAPS